MTFKEWLTTYLPDYESEYSGTLAGLEDAWNAALNAAKEIPTGSPDRAELDELKSTEFRYQIGND